MPDRFRPLGEEPAEDSERVAALFAGRRPATGSADRSPGRAIILLLLLALPLNLAGLLCCTSVPGALVSLWAWRLARRELALLEHGELPVQDTLRLTRLQRLATGMLAASLLLLLAQVYLLTTGFYQDLLLRLDLWLTRL